MRWFPTALVLPRACITGSASKEEDQVSPTCIPVHEYMIEYPIQGIGKSLPSADTGYRTSSHLPA